MPRDSLNLKLILAFFLPLIFMTQMHQISHSMVHAFLTRLSNPTVVIAAFSIAFASETLFLALRLRYHFRATSNLFLHSEA